MLKVLVVTFAYPPMVGGLPQQAHLLNRSLLDMGVVVIVVTMRIDGYPKVDILDNVPIFRLWTLRGTAKSYRSQIYPWLFPLAAFLIRHQHEYDVIHVHQAMHPAAACVIIGKLLHKPTLIRVTGSGASGNIAMLRKWRLLGSLVRKIIRHANCFVSLSEDITSELLVEGIPQEKIIHIPNGVDTEFYSPVSASAKVSVTKTVLGVGRLTEEKGFDILVRAWAKVITQEPAARLVIVGEGLELRTLESLAYQLGIRSTVSFEGNKNNITDYLAHADIFVLPSRNEGMSNALLEAMAMGRACIASDIPANQSVLTPELEGLIFQKNDSDELADQMVRLLQNPQLAKQLGENARDKIVARFSIDQIAKMYINLYTRLATGGHLKT